MNHSNPHGLATAPPPATLNRCPTCARPLNTEHLRFSSDGIHFQNRWHHKCPTKSCLHIIETEGTGWRFATAAPLTTGQKSAIRAKAKSAAEARAKRPPRKPGRPRKQAAAQP